ncbi:hypothetical protein LIER_16821 [Lithospermum erythrorhizon]|uniref:Armadillo repeat-containing protein 7 n=1 Tax=Lithospermum erythrorhizon TaxID=34254 RepID=A0AAV3QAQ5_LITER
MFEHDESLHADLLPIHFPAKFSTEKTKEKIVANLANFSYDPFNYSFLRQLNILELFLDCMTEPNERLVEFGIGGICNACADPANAKVIAQSDGVPLIIQCLSSPVKNTVNPADALSCAKLGKERIYIMCLNFLIIERIYIMCLNFLIISHIILTPLNRSRKVNSTPSDHEMDKFWRRKKLEK